MDSALLVRRARHAVRPRLDLLPDPGPLRSLAILSGSFDPITVGHEALAREAVARAGMVALVYSVRTLPKERSDPPSLLNEEARLEVLERFCAARPAHALGVASHGLLWEQVEAAAQRFPDADLWLVMGSDKVLQLLDPKWYDDRNAVLRDLFAKARVLYGDRAGQEGRVEAVLRLAPNRTWSDRVERILLPPEVASVSSRVVRELLRRGEVVDELLPPEARAALRNVAPPAG